MVAARILKPKSKLATTHWWADTTLPDALEVGNADLAGKRAIKRENLIEATIKEIEKVRKMVRHRRLHGKKDIGTRVHGILKKYYC